jgi:hypothetical protein
LFMGSNGDWRHLYDIHTLCVSQAIYRARMGRCIARLD